MIFQYSGPLELERITAADVDIRDIAHGLGEINRFVGQTRTPISVLWHSMMVAQLCRRAAVVSQFDSWNQAEARPAG